MVRDDVTAAVAGDSLRDVGVIPQSETDGPDVAPAEHDTGTRTRYQAFISYRHGADDAVAAAIERGLERLARPWNRLRAMSVFRDLSDLAAASDLTGAITRGLDESRFLILLASPESAGSPWVDKEVAYWCDRGRGVTQLIVAVTGGEFEWDESTGALTTSTDAVSPAVRSRFITEPLYVDLRWARTANELSLRDSRFRAAIVHIGATIRGIAPADLESEDVRLHRRARRLARVAVATVLVLALVASLAAVVAVVKAREAERRARDALGRQLGLESLDLPPSEVDQAFLLSLVAADLVTGDDANDFQASRTLIGRHLGLDKLLYAPPETTSLNNIAISENGLIAATTGHDLLAWPAGGARDAPSVTDLRDHVGDQISAISFLDGERLLVEGSSSSGVVRIDGDVSDFEPFHDVVDSDTDARLLADRSTSGAITLTDLDSGALLARVDAIDDFHHDLRYGRLAIASKDEVRVVEGRSAADARDRVPSGTVVMAIAAGPTDEVAAVTASADEIVPWSTHGDVLRPADAVALPTGVGQPDRLLVAPDGARVLVVGTAGSAMVDVVAGTAVAFHGYTGRVLADPSGRFAAVGGFAAVGESRLTVWDFDSDVPTFAVPLPIAAMAWSGTCETSCKLVTAGGSLDTWDPLTRRRVHLADQAVQAVATSADGNTVVTAGWGRSVAVWQLRPIIDNSSRTAIGAGDIIARHGLHCPDAGGRDLSAVSPDGALVVTYRPSDGNTTVCRASDGSPVATGLRTELKYLVPDAVAVDNEGNVAIAGWWPNWGDMFVRLLRDGQEFPMEGVTTVQLGSAPVHVTALAYHAHTIVGGLRPDDEVAPAGVGVWSPERGPPTIFESDYHEVPAVAVLGDDAGALVVAERDSPGGDVTLQVWETLTRVRRGRALGGPGLSGDVIVLGGDETEVFAADAAGHAYRWALDRNPTREVCKIVGRPLSRDEWRTFAGGALRRFSPKEMCPAPTAPPPGSVVSNAG